MVKWIWDLSRLNSKKAVLKLRILGYIEILIAVASEKLCTFFYPL